MNYKSEGAFKAPSSFTIQARFVPFRKIRPLQGPIVVFYCLQAGGTGKEGNAMAKDRFVEVYTQGVTNVEKIIVDTQTGVNYVLASSTLTAGCGMSVLVDADGKPIVTPME